MPDENTNSRPAAGLRTHQFLSVLKEQQNKQLLIITVAMPECYRGMTINEGKIAGGKNFRHYQFSKDSPFLLKKIKRLHDEFEPDIIIGVNSYPSFLACSIDSKAIIWADLNGWVLAEGQAQAAVKGFNDYIRHYLNMEKKIIGRADYFSTVSEAQRFAVIGELGICGRLLKDNFGFEQVFTIPNATVFFHGETEKDEVLVKKAEELLEKVPEEAFKLFWVGGYNTWVDEDTLFKGVEAAMKENGNIYFVSTGGGIEGLSNETFKRFYEMVQNSEFKERFVFLGWVETKLIPYIYRRCDVGLNVDKMCVETLTGARNRINEMMKFGLPMVTTFGSEIAEVAVNAGCGVGVRSGDYVEMSAKIVEMCEKKESGELLTFRENCLEFTKNNSYLVMLEPLISRLDVLKPGFDNANKKSFYSGFRYLSENGIKKTLKKVLNKIVSWI